MMSPQTFQTVLVLTFALSITTALSSQPLLTYDCPKDCECIVIQGSRPLNHAKCSSLEGLHDAKHLPIHSIDLSHAGITKVSHYLEKLRDLINIDLSNNHLTDVPSIGRRVTSLKLSHNKITSDKLNAINSHIHDLDLSYNEITYLPLTLRQLTKLRTLELTGNKINCTCETLEVRNWLQSRSVYTDNHVKCFSPRINKGKPWLQVKQATSCDEDENEDDNDLMMGDAPYNGSGEEDELDKDFIRVPKEEQKDSTKTEKIENETEGSGDLSVPLMEMNRAAPETTSEAPETTISEDDDTEGSGGSGAGPIIALNIDMDEDHTDSDVHFTDELDDNETIKPIQEPYDINSSPEEIFNKHGLGIFQEPSSTENQTEVSEDEISPVVFKEVEGIDTTSVNNLDEDNEHHSENIKVENVETANAAGDSRGTYILMAVLVLIVVGLILFVGIKKAKQRRNRNAYDEENPRSTELADMDKGNLGKPIAKNGHEQAPLIGEKTKEDMAKPINGQTNGKRPHDGDKTNQEPLLDNRKDVSDTGAPTKQNNSHLDVDTPVHRIIPRYPPPKSPRASKYNRDNDNNNNDDNNDDVFLPSSPRSGRYSPVYSPETGRVKIKLTETPKPKTPMLVTRSKSNAGEIITTPVSQKFETNNNLVVQ